MHTHIYTHTHYKQLAHESKGTTVAGHGKLDEYEDENMEMEILPILTLIHIIKPVHILHNFTR